MVIKEFIPKPILITIIRIIMNCFNDLKFGWSRKMREPKKANFEFWHRLIRRIRIFALFCKNERCTRFSDLIKNSPQTIKLEPTYLQVSKRPFFLPPLCSEGCIGSTLASSFFSSVFFSSLWWVINSTP